MRIPLSQGLALVTSCVLATGSCVGGSDSGASDAGLLPLPLDAAAQHSCSGELCDRTEVFVSQSAQYGYLTADATNLYWQSASEVDTLGNMVGGGAIMTCRVDDCQPAVVVEDAMSHDRIAVDGEYLYWISSQTLFRAKKDGTASKEAVYVFKAATHKVSYRVAGDRLIATDSDGGAAYVTTMDLDGGNAVSHQVSTYPQTWGLAIHEENAYTIGGDTADAARELVSVPLNGDDVVVFESLSEFHDSVQGDANVAYLVMGSEARIQSRNYQTNEVLTLFSSDQAASLEMIITEQSLLLGYQTSNTTAGLAEVSKEPKQPRILLELDHATPSAMHIATSADYLYWSQNTVSNLSNTWQIWRVPVR